MSGVTMARKRQNRVRSLHLPSLSFPNFEEVFQLSGPDALQYRKKLKAFSGRSLLLTDSEDSIVLDGKPDDSFLDYLSSLGLGTRSFFVAEGEGDCLSRDLLANRDLQRGLKGLAKTGSFRLVPYMASELDWEVSRRVGLPLYGGPHSVVCQLNSKIFCKRLFEDLGLPFYPFQVFNSKLQREHLSQFLGRYKKSVIRGDKGIGGSLYWEARSRKDWEPIGRSMKKFEKEILFLVEPWMPLAASPNIQFEISEESIAEVFLSDQIFSKNGVHVGNVFPLTGTKTDKIGNYAVRIAEAAGGMGYRGILGIDFIVTRDGEIFPSEINARQNSSTYTAFLARKLFPPDRLRRKFIQNFTVPCDPRLRFQDVADRLGEKELFQPEKGTGVFPYNIGRIPFGEVDVILFADTKKEIGVLRGSAATLGTSSA